MLRICKHSLQARIRFNIYYDKPFIKTVVDTSELENQKSSIVITNDERALAYYSVISPTCRLSSRSIIRKDPNSFNFHGNYFQTILHELGIANKYVPGTNGEQVKDQN